MNNNDTNNDGLNTLSLGSIDNNSTDLNVPISDIPPIAPVESMETLDNQLDVQESSNIIDIKTETASNINAIPVASVVPEVQVEPLNNENLDVIIEEPFVFNEIGTVPPINNNNSVPIQPVAPAMDSFSTTNYDIPKSINDFNISPMFTEIGTMPPIPDVPIGNVTNEPPKKKGINKILFVIIIVLALVAVGVGIYVFLHMTNTKNVPVVTKELKLEIGSEISSNISDYASFKGVDSTTCSLDTSNIDTSKYNAEYTYTVTCNNTSYTGKVTIVDTVKPTVITKEVSVQVNSEITADLFIESCADNTNCSYSFEDETKVKNYLKTPESYRVDIIIKDEAGNETEVTVSLIVTDTIASLYLVCSKEQSSYTEVTKLGLVDGVFNKFAVRTYTFKFSSSALYNTFRNENFNKSQVTYNGITGSPTYYDNTNILTLTRNMSYDELNIETGSTLPTSVGELKSFYQNIGYSCNIGF